MVRLRAWGEVVAELAGDGEDDILPRFRLAGTAPYFLRDSLYVGNIPDTGYNVFNRLIVSIFALRRLPFSLYIGGWTRAYKAVDLILT